MPSETDAIIAYSSPAAFAPVMTYSPSVSSSRLVIFVNPATTGFSTNEAETKTSSPGISKVPVAESNGMIVSP